VAQSSPDLHAAEPAGGSAHEPADESMGTSLGEHAHEAASHVLSDASSGQARPAVGLTIDAVLGPQGVLAACVPHYEDRPAQRDMARAVATALDEGRVLLAEAGTGTGKTLAYLVPALLSGKRVVVSTGTRALQDQITRHDIPLLEELMPRQFTAVTLKGVSNYLCLRKLNDGAALAALRTEETRRDLAVILDWARETATGDRAEVAAVADDAAVWPAVTNTPDTRLGPRCPYYEQCFVTRARRRAEKADIILVNHHLFFADLALRSAYPGARVLPEYDAVVFDEAHQLEDVMTDHFGVQLSTVRLAQVGRDAHHAFTRPGGPLFSSRRPEDRASERIVEHVERCAEGFFAAVRRALAERAPGETGRIAIDDDLFADQARQDAWFRLDTALDELAAHAALTAEQLARDQAAAGEPAGGQVDDRIEALEAVSRRAAAIRDDMALLAERSERAFVYWGEIRGAGVLLCAAPVDVSPYMRQHVVPQAPAIALTSATLRAGAGFDYVRQRLGLDQELADELTVPSPFDYTRQALLYLPRDLPHPREPGFIAAACVRVAELCAITSGRAFVLFTSHRALREAARRLAGALPYELMVQGDMPRATLLDRFRARPGSVLLGTGTFWEGVDVPGDALSLVIIDKLPFAPHTDPLIRARMQRIESEQGEAFDTYQLPQAALALKQGFGRLIRRGDDRGIVAVLDHRIVMRRYGRVFLDTLPESLPRTSVLEQVRRWWHGQVPAGPAPE
jgi:ATP-dependent DNA helicase DinG